MGIKGIYGEIGPGKRIALVKLAVEKLEQTGRPLRLAIDISIWQFQIQSGKGGPNPALRTLYYRLLRLMSLSIQPLFVFDGPHKPTLKRNKKISTNSDNLPTNLAKHLLRLFGFPFHVAPGEAEAECALLQRSGIVDAVLSEDVDTLMFGCGLTFRNWSSEESKGNYAPSHVSVYDAGESMKTKFGLDREGMILVAMMSGGDYNTEGIPGCGIKLACEAAKAGFGQKLCNLSITDTTEFKAWRQELAHEIQTNEHKIFRTKHKALKIPEEFPRIDILSYYTDPAISSPEELVRLEEELSWEKGLDVFELRRFVADRFEWTNRTGAKKFIRGLAPALLVSKLLTRANRRASEYGDVVLTAMNEMELVRVICGRRTHFSTDGIPELRLIYVPAEIVGLDLDEEKEGPSALGNDDQEGNIDNDVVGSSTQADFEDPVTAPASPTKRVTLPYDPTLPDRIWIAESIAKFGVPLEVEDYEETLRAPKTPLAKKKASRKAPSQGGMPRGALTRYLTVTKPIIRGGQTNTGKINHDKPPSQPSKYSENNTSSSQGVQVSPQTISSHTSPQKNKLDLGRPTKQHNLSSLRRTNEAAKISEKETNPWTLSQSSMPRRTVGAQTSTLSSTIQRENKDETKVPSQDLYEQASQTTDTASPTRSAVKNVKRQGRPITPLLKSDVHTEAPPTTPSIRPRSPSQQSPLKKRSPRAGSGPHRRLSSQARVLFPSSDAKPASGFNSQTEPSEGQRHISLSPDISLPSLEDILVHTPTQNVRATKSSKTRRSERLGHNTEVIVVDSPRAKQAGCDAVSTQHRVYNIEKSSDDAVAGAGPKEKRFVMLRESLEGAWTEMTETERGSSLARDNNGRNRRVKVWRKSEVEIMDLTSP